MTGIYALTFLFAVFAFGEFVAFKTKAVLSATLVMALVMAVGFWCGLPADIFQTSGVQGIGMLLIGILITSLGTMMDFHELAAQWKTLVISLAGVVCGVVLIVLIGTPLLGRDMTIAGAPIFAGANTATLIMTSALNEKGLTEAAAFCVLVLVTQNLIGIPISSYLLRREAKLFLANPKNLEKSSVIEDGGAVQRKRRPLEMSGFFCKPAAVITKLALVYALSFFIAGLTNGKVHQFVVCLLAGIIFSELGFLDKNSLTKTDAGQFIIFAPTIVIFANLAQTSPSMILSMIGPLLICLGVGVIGVAIAGIVVSKLLRVSPYVGVTLGLTCTYGFPTTMLMSKEVGEAIGRTPEEKEAITNFLMPQMITAGFVTVTIMSVIIAGVVATMI